MTEAEKIQIEQEVEDGSCEFMHVHEEIVKKVEILPYHSLGLFKWQNLGIPYTLEGVPAPTKEEVERAEKILGIRKAD